MELNKLLQIRSVLFAHVDDKLCASLAYRIMKYLKSTDQEENFYIKRMQDITEEYGEKSVDGTVVRGSNGEITIKRDKIEECKKIIDELNKTKVEVPDIKFTVDELSELKLTVKEMYALDDLITP